MNNPTDNLKGFTLVEILVVMALAGMIFYGMHTLFRLGSQQANALNVRMTIEDSAREGLTRMLQEIRESTPAKISASSSSLTLQIPAGVDSSGHITWSSPVTYGLSGNSQSQLVRTSGGSSQVVANNVQNMAVTLNPPSAPTLVTVRLDLLRQSIEGRSFSETLIGQGKVRND
jgi:prepilin-type N-terminal cleavage/methylation domain-containing protein